MNQPRILLLDGDTTAAGLGSRLRGILEPSFRLGTQLCYERIGDSEATLRTAGLTATLADFNPEVTFLILSQSSPQQVCTLFQAVKKELPQNPIIVVIEAVEPDNMFALLKLGVADFITPPLKAIDILPRIWRLMEQTRQGETLTQTLKEKLGLKQLVGESPVFLAEVKKIPLVAKCNARILIKGETGTGKELFARAIHYLSPRTSRPFIPINCGAIPTDLMENELFGHERGAFTGAITTQAGLVNEAEGGTLFLDEVDCLPPLAQVKLLRFLQDKEYRRLGSSKLSRADVRVIAATNIDLEKAVEEGRLRQDLYYRLNIIQFMLPPLRQRSEDVPVLARHFLVKYAREFDKEATDFSPEAIHFLMVYDWPGNVRELEHVVERAVVLAEQKVIQASDIILSCSGAAPRRESLQEAKARVVVQFEKNYVKGLLLAYKGNITKAAQAAGKNRRAFWQLIRKHCIDVESFKVHAS